MNPCEGRSPADPREITCGPGDAQTICQPLTVLIVEDSAIVSRRLAAAIEGAHGIALPEVARDGAQARRVFERVRPDVVLLDLHLPDISGLDLLREYKARQPASTVLVLTSFAFAQLRARCVALGADGFFDKASEFEQAIARVRRLGFARASGSGGTPR